MDTTLKKFFRNMTSARLAALLALFLCMAVGILTPAFGSVAHAASSVLDETVGKIFAKIAEIFFTGGAQLLALAGWLLDHSVKFALDTNNYAKGSLEAGWTVLRDVANIFFIFILLYIAIGTILQLEKINTKQALVNVIIIAFLINFSLFFTKVIVDASNILATLFYNNAISITIDEKAAGLGTILATALGPQSLFDGSAFKALDNTTTGLAYVFGFFVMFLAAFSFLSVAVMFLIRTASLILLMILSPLAFIAWVLDDFREYFTQWWKTLLGQAFFAPAYLLVISVVLTIILTPQFQSALGQQSLAKGIDALVGKEATKTFGAEDFIPGGSLLNSQAFGLEDISTPRGLAQGGIDRKALLAKVGETSATRAVTGGETGTLSVFFAYLLIIFLINGALVVAKKLGGATAEYGVGLANKAKGLAWGGTKLAAGFGWQKARGYIQENIGRRMEKRLKAKAPEKIAQQMTTKTGRFILGMQRAITKPYAEKVKKREEFIKSFGPTVEKAFIEKVAKISPTSPIKEAEYDEKTKQVKLPSRDMSLLSKMHGVDRGAAEKIYKEADKAVTRKVLNVQIQKTRNKIKVIIDNNKYKTGYDPSTDPALTDLYADEAQLQEQLNQLNK